MLYCCFIKSSIALWRIPLLAYCTFGEEGKEVIKNDFEAAINLHRVFAKQGIAALKNWREDVMSLWWS